MQHQENAVCLLPGTKLRRDRYEIRELLGVGGFGITYKAWDNNLDIPVAIKEYFPRGSVQRMACLDSELQTVSKNDVDLFEKGKQRFIEEAKILARFHGKPGIVGVFDHFEENRTAYMVMEYLEGITLEKAIRQQGKLPLNELLRNLRPVMESLDTIHREGGIIHRDISPDNLMQRPGGSLVLMDFGAARGYIDRETVTPLTQIHKMGYSPSEQYSPSGQGAWTDVYAMCATLYHCITGKTPISSLERKDGCDIRWPSELGAEITPKQEYALKKGMSLKAEDRYQTMAELMEALQPEMVRSRKPKKRTWIPWAVGGCAAALALGGGILIGLHPWENTDGVQTTAATTTTISGAYSKPIVLEEGKLTEKISWKYTSDATLTFSGEGILCSDNDSKALGEELVNKFQATKIVVEDGITGFGENSFCHCISLRELVMADSVVIVGSGAFMDCENLSEILFSNNLSNIEDGAFFRCRGIVFIAFPESLTYLGSICGSCTSLETVVIPKSVTKIEATFFECWALKEFIVSEDNPVFSSENGILYNKDQTRLVRYPGTAKGTVEVKSGVESIASFAFSYNSDLAAVRIPSSVNAVESDAFYISSIQDIYYEKGKEEWENIISHANSEEDSLKNAKIHFNNIVEPYTKGWTWQYAEHEESVLSQDMRHFLDSISADELPKEAVEYYVNNFLDDSVLKQFLWNDILLPLATIPEEDITLYGVVDDNMEDAGIFIRFGEDVRYYPLSWSSTLWHDSFPWMQVGDFNSDGKKELAVSLWINHGTSCAIHSLCIFDLETLSYQLPDCTEIPLVIEIDDASDLLTITGGGISASTSTKDYENMEVGIGEIITFEVAGYDSSELLCKYFIAFGEMGDFPVLEVTSPVLWNGEKYVLGEPFAIETFTH